MTCAIYCRLSREDEDRRGESESIQNQRAMLEGYAEERGWPIYDVYCDEDCSGADARRPDFCRLLRDAELGRFRIVLCKTQSRFTRDMELVERYLHGKFPRWGVRFIAVADHVDTEQRGNKKARQISGLINQWYLEDLSENIRMVLDFKRRQGQYIGATPLYGYRRDPADKNRLIPDPEAAKVVREIFARCLAGEGPGQIAAALNGQNVPNPARYKGGGDANQKWSRLAVSRILRSEMYAGTMVQGRQRKLDYKSKCRLEVPEQNWFRVEGTHAGLVSGEAFRRVQTLLGPGGRRTRTGEVMPLSGLVYCGRCGRKLRRKSNGHGRDYLRCPDCPGCSVRLDRLTGAILGRLGVMSDSPDAALRELMVRAVERVEVGKSPQKVEIWWKI